MASFEARSLRDRAPQDEGVGVFHLRRRTACPANGGHPLSLMLRCERESASLEARINAGPSMIVDRDHRLGADPRRDVCAHRAGADAAIWRRPHHEPRLWRVPRRRRLRRLVAVHGQRGQPARRADLHRAGGLHRQLADLRPPAHAAGQAREVPRPARGRLDPLHLRPAVRHAGADARRCSAASSTATPTCSCRSTCSATTVSANRLLALVFAVDHRRSASISR